MDDYVRECEIEKYVLGWKSFICRVVRSPTILSRMPNFLSNADVNEIKNIDERQSSTKATFVFIDKLLKCKQPGKWMAFRQALQDSDYGYLASLLSSRCKSPVNSLHQRKMLQIFSPYLDMLEPIELMCHLSASGLINSQDQQEIVACQEHQGSVAATMLMLDRLQRHQAPSVWYMELLRVLHRKGYTELVLEMEPDFSMDCQVLKVPSIIFTDSSDSEVDTCKSTDSILEDAIENKVSYFKSEIIELVTVEKLLPHICSLISFDRVCNVVTRQSATKKESMEYILEEIQKSKSKTKWRSFVECLQRSDYQYVAELLIRPRPNQSLHKERCLLNIFTHTLGAQLEPMVLLPYLMEENVINQRDKVEIMAMYQRSGAMAASFVLLECMQCRLAPCRWYKAFLQSLMKCDRQDLVEMVDPDFVKRLNKNSENVHEDVFNSADTELLEELEKAYCHLHQMKKESAKVLSSIRDKFRNHEQQLVHKIDETYQVNIKILDDISERISCLENRSDTMLSEKATIQESLASISSKEFLVIPERRFMDLKQLATVKESDHRFPNNSGFSLMPSDNRRRLFARTRHISVGSSSSSSSGFVLVNKSKSSDISISSDNDISTSLDKGPRVTFANNAKPSRALTVHTQVSAESFESRGVAKCFDKSHLVTNRRRCLSESSMFSIDGSMSSSFDRPSSSNTDRKTESPSLSSTLTKVSTFSEKKHFERTDSFLYHQGFVLPKEMKCLLSHICVLPTKHVVLLNCLKSCMYIFDEITKPFKEFYFNRYSPLKVCALNEPNLLVLLQKRDGSTKLDQYEILFSDHKKVDDISIMSEVLLRDNCQGCLCAISSTKDRVIGLCLNKHIHVLSQDCCELNVISLNIQGPEWWPHLCAVDSSCLHVFIHDVYSLNIYCFTNILEPKDHRCSPEWVKHSSEIEGMVVCVDHLYVSKNSCNLISRLSILNGKEDNPLSENVHHPFALSCIPGQGTIIVTQFYPEGTRINRTVKYF